MKCLKINFSSNEEDMQQMFEEVKKMVYHSIADYNENFVIREEIVSKSKVYEKNFKRILLTIYFLKIHIKYYLFSSANMATSWGLRWIRRRRRRPRTMLITGVSTTLWQPFNRRMAGSDKSDLREKKANKEVINFATIVNLYFNINQSYLRTVILYLFHFVNILFGYIPFRIDMHGSSSFLPSSHSYLFFHWPPLRVQIALIPF